MILTTLTQRLRSKRAQLAIALVTLTSLLTMLSVSFAVDITTITPDWQSPVGSSGAPSCLVVDNASSPVTVRYGDTNPLLPCAASPAQQSGFGFTAGSAGTFTNGTPFLLGELTHYNNQVFASSLLTGATLNFNFVSSSPVLPSISSTIALDETANNLSTCPYGDTAPCADRVTLTRRRWSSTTAWTIGSYKFSA
ncbi:MAG: choice-of-anchor K domain-containing protein [Anaerolineae bacterium]|nr:choice-of-anchor K domain-containing protein [Anaerolineae bacterium]